MDGIDTFALFVVITIAATLWMMFTDNTATPTPRYNYHANEIYGE